MSKALELAKFGRETPPTGVVVGDSDAQTLSSKTFSDGPVFSGLNANGVPFLNASRVLSSSATFVFDGANLGVGVASPAAVIHANAAGGGTIRASRSSVGGEYVQLDHDGTDGTLRVSGNNKLFLTTNGTTRVTILGSGNVGIGNNNPDYPLEISSTNPNSITWQRTGVSAKKWGFTSDNSYTYLYNHTDGVLAVGFPNAGGIILPTTATAIQASDGYNILHQTSSVVTVGATNRSLRFATSASASAMTLSTTGGLSIGLTADAGAGNILLPGNSGTIFAAATTGSRSYIELYNNSTGDMSIATTYSTAGIRFLTGGTTTPTERLRINSTGDSIFSGNVRLYNYVNSGSENNRLAWDNGIYNIGSIRMIVGAGQINRGEMGFYVNNGASEQLAMNIDYAQNVKISQNLGIGAAPTAVTGFGINKFLEIAGASVPGLVLRPTGSTSEHSVLGAGDGLLIGATGAATATNNVIRFFTSNVNSSNSPTERLRIESNGTIKKLGTNGGLLLMDGNTAGGVKIGAYAANLTTDGYLAFEGYSIEYGRFDTAGNFMVGATSTSAIANRNIDVNGTGDASFNVRVGGSTVAYLYSTAGQSILGTNINIPLTFYPNNVKRMSINTDGTVVIGNAVAATNVVLNFNGVANKAKRLVFQDSGVDQWLIGSGAASENDAFEIYNANGQMALTFAKASSTATFYGVVAVPTLQASLGSTNGWINTSYGSIGSSQLLSYANQFFGYNLRGYRSTDGGSTNNNFYTMNAHGSMGFSGIEQDFGGFIRFYTSSTAYQATTANTVVSPTLAMTIKPGGNVGIGTSDPAHKLDVNGTSIFRDTLNFGSGGNLSWTSGYSDGTTQTFSSNSGGSLALIANGSLGLFVKSNQYVGIGTSGPSGPLHVHQDSGGPNCITMSTTFVNGNSYAVNPFVQGISNGGFSIRDVTNGADRIVIQYSTGYVGIGTSQPTVRLEVNGEIKSAGIDINQNNNLLYFTKTGGSTGTSSNNTHFIGRVDSAGYHVTNGAGGFDSIADSFVVGAKGSLILATSTPTSTYSSGRVIIDQTGNVGISTVNPTEKLHVRGIANGNGAQGPRINLQYSGTSGGAESLVNFLDFRGNVNAAIGNDLQDDGVSTAAAHLVFKTAHGGTLTQRMRINRYGYVTKPYQPAFSASNSGSVSISSDAVIPFSVSNFNVGNCYNTSTYTFTAPVAGMYVFTLTCTMTGQGTSGTYNAIYVIKNGAGTALRFRITGNLATNIWTGNNGACTIYLEAGDSIKLQGYTDTGTMTIQAGEGTFSGYLLG